MITDPTEEYFKDGVWGYDGTQWRKLALAWGYTSRLCENLGGTKSGAGTYSVYSTAVPAGEVHTVQKVSLLNGTTSPSTTFVFVKSGGVEWRLLQNSSPSSTSPDVLTGPITLAAGDQIRIVLQSCLDADIIYAVLWGTVMAVT